MAELIKNGEVVRGSIGNLVLMTISSAQARRANLGTTGGVFVNNMSKDDSAFLGGRGILPGDIIVRFNQTDVTEQSQLQRLIADATIGSTATIDVLRKGQPHTFQISVVRQSYGQAAR
jgi:S1-C subfamily serine protease